MELFSIRIQRTFQLVSTTVPIGNVTNHASGKRFGKEAPEAYSYGEDESGQRCDARGTFAPVLAVEAGRARALRMYEPDVRA